MPVGERRRAIPDAICELMPGCATAFKAEPRVKGHPAPAGWWSQTESNRRHPACKAGALPTELWPHSVGMVRSPGALSYDTVQGWSPAGLVGPGRLELPTLRLSGVRSNHLSYGPMAATARSSDPGSRSRHPRNDPYGRGVDDESGKRNGDGGVPHCVLGAVKRFAMRSLNSLVRDWRSILRKEVIQPQVPLRLPCYDFTPVADPTVVACLLAVSAAPSGRTNSHGVTGGVYKARERIHRGMLIRDY